MNLIDYLDFKTVFEEVKKNHLEEFPTPESFKEYLKETNESFDFVDEMYYSFKIDLEEVSFPSSKTHDYNLFREHVDDNLFDIELFMDGGQDYEDSDGKWAFGFIYTINLEEELFSNYQTENYS